MGDGSLYRRFDLLKRAPATETSKNQKTVMNRGIAGSTINQIVKRNRGEYEGVSLKSSTQTCRAQFWKVSRTVISNSISHLTAVRLEESMATEHQPIEVRTKRCQRYQGAKIDIKLRLNGDNTSCDDTIAF